VTSYKTNILVYFNFKKEVEIHAAKQELNDGNINVVLHLLWHKNQYDRDFPQS